MTETVAWKQEGFRHRRRGLQWERSVRETRPTGSSPEVGAVARAAVVRKRRLD